MPLGQGVHQDARDLLKDMEVYYLPGDLQSCFTGEPGRRQQDTWGVKEWTEYNANQEARKAAKKFVDDVKAYKKSLSTSRAGTSHLPPSVSTKTSRVTGKALTPDTTQVSQVSEAPTEDTSSVGGNPATVCGHLRITPGTLSSTSTGTSHGSTEPGPKPL